MLKKLLVGTLLIFVIGTLVAGAIFRTKAKTATTIEGEQRQGQDHSVESQQAGQEGHSYGNADNISDADPNDPTETGDRGGQRTGRGANGGSSNEQANASDIKAQNWQAHDSRVVSVDTEMLILARTDGEETTFEGQAWRYAQEQGFWTDVGNIIVVKGYYEDEHFMVAEIYDMTNGQSILVRDETGRPFWAGEQGRGGNRGA